MKEVHHETVQPNQTDQLSQGACPEIAPTWGKQGDPLVITQNGEEPRWSCRTSKVTSKRRETMALLKNRSCARQVEKGKVQSSADVIKGLREAGRKAR